MRSTSSCRHSRALGSRPRLVEGWGIQKPADAFDEIMQALGYERYGVHGGDIGAGIAEALCVAAGERSSARWS